jgi:hypothetical protein
MHGQKWILPRVGAVDVYVEMLRGRRNIFQGVARGRLILRQGACLLLLQLTRSGLLLCAGLRAAPAPCEKQQRKDESESGAPCMEAHGALEEIGVLHRLSISIRAWQASS